MMLTCIIFMLQVQNDPNVFGKLLEILHARWSLAAPTASPRIGVLPPSESSPGNTSETTWQLDCDALLALFYLEFAGGFVTEQVLELHLLLFLVKCKFFLFHCVFLMFFQS